MERSLLEGYIAHKWNLQEEILPDSHPYSSLDPFGITVNQLASKSVGGDPAEVTIYWGDERVETESTSLDENNDSLWDYSISLSETASIGQLEVFLTENLEEGKSYYYSCLLYTSPSPRDRQKSRMPSSA